MKNKTNLFVCILISLSINLQWNISAYAEDKVPIAKKQDLNKFEVFKVIDLEAINDEEDVDHDVDVDEVTDGVTLTAPIFVNNTIY